MQRKPPQCLANRAVATAIRLSPRSLWLELIARQQPRGADGTQEA